VVHDFNNLLTGITLYCDLLLSSFDSRDLRRRYAEEIRGAVVQAEDLARRLLECARPQATSADCLSLNQTVAAMRDLLARLIGENIILELRLDPGLGAVKIARAQAQQIVLNLILNARDALPEGGVITVETRNCRFQPVAATSSQNSLPAFPCVLLVVADNGQGMSAETRGRLFEPFFTTKSAGQGNGLGLATVRSIVTEYHGLIYFESQPDQGTRAMILLPRASQHADAVSSDAAYQDSGAVTPIRIQVVNKESLL
jgi:signal transduction histidine kinase